MNAVNISNIQKKVRLSQKKIKFLTENILTLLKVKNKVLSVLFTDDKQIKKLNRIYRKKNYATDVLAFSMREGKFTGLHPEILGDIVISAETAKRIAKKHNFSLIREISLYLIHGILHLLGHRDSAKQLKKMKIMENRIFLKLWNEGN